MEKQWNELKAIITELRDNGGTGTQKEVCKFLVNLMDKLEEQASSSEEPNKWISISKEVPKKCGWYITSTIYNEVYCDYWEGDRFDRSEVVTAWMPLPNAYKESEEG